MICRYENTRYDTILVIDECEKFLGETTVDKFVDAMEERDSFQEQEYDWFHVNKNKLFNLFRAKIKNKSELR